MRLLQRQIQLVGYRFARSARSLVIALASCCATASAWALDITLEGRIVWLKGDIEEGDTFKLQRLLAAQPKEDVRPLGGGPEHELLVFITSRGGSFEEGMDLGRFLRRRRAAVSTVEYCASSCISVLAAGVVRRPDGLLLIHRGASGLPVPGKIAAMEKTWARYLEEMNIPKSLAERAFSTPFEEAHALTPQEISGYRLDQLDMEFAEALAHYNAEASGLSREEYHARVNLVRDDRKKCDAKKSPSRETVACYMAAEKQHGLRGNYHWILYY